MTRLKSSNRYFCRAVCSPKIPLRGRPWLPGRCIPSSRFLTIMTIGRASLYLDFSSFQTARALLRFRILKDPRIGISSANLTGLQRTTSEYVCMLRGGEDIRRYSELSKGGDERATEELLPTRPVPSESSFVYRQCYCSGILSNNKLLSSLD